MDKEVRKHKRRGLRIPESVKKTSKIFGASLYTLGFALLHSEMENPLSPTSVVLTSAGENIDKFALANIHLGHLATAVMNLSNDFIFQTFGLNLPRAELINFIDIALMAPFLVAGTISLSNIFKTENKALLYGEEVVKGTPSHVIFAPNCEILEKIVRSATESGKISNKKNSEVVGIHGDRSIPLDILPVDKQPGLIGHHFPAEPDLFDSPNSATSKALRKDSGTDKASEITFYCLPNIYMSDKDVEFSAEKVRPFLLSLGDNLDGKTINIIMPEIEIEYDGSVRTQLNELQKKLVAKNIKFQLNFYTPERAFERVVEKKVIEFAVSRKVGPIQILHIEQSQEDYISDEDKALFAQENEPIFVGYHNQIRKIMAKLAVSDISESKPVRVDRVSVSMNDIDHNIRVKLTDELNRELESIESTQMVVVSAFSDQEAVEMTKKMIDDVPDLKRRLLVVIDKSKRAKELWDPENNLLVETFIPSESVITDFSNDRTANDEHGK